MINENWVSCPQAFSRAGMTHTHVSHTLLWNFFATRNVIS
jgi:hypothetical protein